MGVVTGHTVSYKHEPISRDQVRLVKFDFDSNRTTALLRTFSLSESIPPLNALSYSWLDEGPMTDTTEKCYIVETEAGQLQILETIHTFLRALAIRDAALSAAWWWIDSICINLDDLNERSEQVQLMGRIYRNARDVIIWLGSESSDTDLAIDFIQLLNKTVRRERNTEKIRSTFEQDQYLPHWAALASFFQRRWWSRIWTLQEYALNSNTFFWCGTRTLRRFTVEGALIVADRCNAIAFRSTAAFRHGFNRRRVQTLYEKDDEQMRTISMAALSAYSSCFEATDDRDRLYGIMALTNDADLLDVDYSYSVEETYLRFATGSIEHHNSLDIICFASIYHSKEDSVLPSWVPDWRAGKDPVCALTVPLMVSQSGEAHIDNLRNELAGDKYRQSMRYAASKDRVAEYTFHQSRLVARGTVVDVIDGLAGSRTADLVQSTAPVNVTSAAPSVITSVSVPLVVCECLVLARKDRFLRFAIPVAEFFNDFMWLCDRLTTYRASVPKEFRDWYRRTRSLLIHGRSLEDTRLEYNETVHNDLSSWTANRDEHVRDTFFGRFYDTFVRMSLRLIVTEAGHIGMASAKARKGDLVVVLFGCSVPVLLRQSDSAKDGVFTLVGECYLHGFMGGEGLRAHEYPERDFCIE